MIVNELIMTEEADYSSLPLEEKLNHKLWKARLEAYDELSKRFRNSRNSNDDCFNMFNEQPDIFKKMLTDSNVVSQEGAIGALANFLEFGGSKTNSSRIKSTGVVPILCEKGLSSTRSGTKSKSIECLLLFIEIIDKGDGIVEDMLPTLSHRTPKVVSGCVGALATLVENYGCNSIISPKLFIPSLSKLFSHADRNVRSETSRLTVEIYKWMGHALEDVLFPSLKPVQQKDLSKAFEGVERTGEQKRLTRSQKEESQRLQNEVANEADADADASGDVQMTDAKESSGADQVEVDAFEIVEPTSVLNKFPLDLSERLSSTKWKDRKEALDEVYDILRKVMKLDPNDDYLDFVRLLSKCMRDANVQVVQLAALCVERVSKGLRKSFQKYQSLVLGPMIERTKERKVTVAEALNQAMDSIFEYSSLGAILDEAVAGMKHKTPQVKIASINYIQRCLKATKTAPTGLEIDSIMEVGVKLVSDSQESIRLASCEMIGTLMKITGERELNSYMEKIDDSRSAKIRKVCDEVEVNAKLSSSQNNAQGATPPKKLAAVNELTSKPVKLRSSNNSGVSAAVRNPTPGKKLSLPSTASTSRRQSTTPSGPSTIPSKRGATSPAKRLEDTTNVKQPSFSRSLIGRSLMNSSNASPNVGSKVDATLGSKEKEELLNLRKEKLEWLELKTETLKVSSQLEEEKLKHTQDTSAFETQLASIQKMNSNSLQMIKQKETQIFRLHNDLENAKLKIRDLEQTIEMMRLQPNYGNQTQSQQTMQSHSGLFSSMLDHQKENTMAESPAKQLRMTSGELNSQVKRLSIDGYQSKEGSVLSPTKDNFSQSNSPDKLSDNNNSYSARGYPDFGTNDDSWRRAAEVTSQLKARIEKMKARSKNSISNMT